MTTRVVFLALLLAAAAARAEFRTWTTTSGATMEAELVEQRAGLVVLRNRAGELFRIRPEQLGEEDRAALRQPPVPGGRAGAAPREESTALEGLFGADLENAAGGKVKTSALAGKTVGIYFTASWCPPCRAFTPKLVEAYKAIQENGQPFEVVMVSSDREKKAMRSYMKDADMPWLAVPFGSKESKKLQEQFKVSGIPRLVIVDAAGRTVAEDGRGAVMAEGAKAFERWK